MELTPQLTFEEACGILRCHRTVLRKLLLSGTVKARKVGRAWRINPESLQSYLNDDDAVVAKILRGNH